MKGVALDTPLFKFRYVKVQGNVNEQASSRPRVDDVTPKRDEKIASARIKTTYVIPAQISTMGLDAMVSSAAVIHELAYGRMAASATPVRPDAGYDLRGEFPAARLNIVV